MVALGNCFLVLMICAFANAQVITNWINLRVDNFNVLDRRSFEARYFVNNELWVPGGPIFINVGDFYFTQNGSEFLTHGAIYDIANETNGLLLSLETRYFGLSRPTEDTSLENLRFLHLHQIVEDYGHFINFVRKNFNGSRNSKVVLWGSQNGGTVAVHIRQKYPHLVDAVWASSAYINTVLEYPQAMSNTFATINTIGGPECGRIIADAFEFMENSVLLRDTSFLEERLRLCYPVDLNDEQDVARLFWGVAHSIVFNFLSIGLYTDIPDMCDLMSATENPPENPLDAFARWFTDDLFDDLECYNVNNSAIVASAQEIEWDSVSTATGGRQIFWLQCTQIGQFSIANEGIGHPFGRRFDVNFVRQWCAKVFGEEVLTLEVMQNSIRTSEVLFGGMNPQIEQVFFTHGELDPSRNKGPTEDLNPNAPVVVMPRQSANRDFESSSDTDDEILLQTKARARELILQWISN